MIDLRDLPEESVSKDEFSVIICCSGYEERCRFLAKRLLKEQRLDTLQKFVIPFHDFLDNEERRRNDEFFQKYGFAFCDFNYESFGSVSRWLNSIVEELPPGSKILVDYSAMKRTMYSEMIRSISEDVRLADKIFVFSYSVGIAVGSYHPKIVSDYVLIPGFEGDSNSQKEKFAIYTLGFEPITLHSVHEWIEPSQSIAIYAEPGVKRGSGERCLKVNKRFLDQNNVPTIPISLSSVDGCCRAILERAKSEIFNRDVIIFSAGPKPFVLASLVASSILRFPTNVYAHGVESRPVNVKPIGTIIASSLSQIHFHSEPGRSISA